MTGDVPYYGGRFTPAQAYAASHRQNPPPRPLPEPTAGQVEALQRLLDAGVVTPTEYKALRDRVGR